MTSSTSNRITVHHRCSVAPAASTAAALEHRLPLTFFDMLCLYFHPIQRLLFYPHPCSTTNFLEKIVPNLKTSLSKTLTHYLPLSGNLIRHLNSDKPELLYSPGDSIVITFAEANGELDFNHLAGNQPREAHEFYSLTPDLPDPKTESELGFEKTPLLAIQVTLFPETGICIGITNHHVVGDASSIVGFVKAWSKLAKLEENGNFSHENFPAPIFDRSLIKDPSGRADIFWNQMREFKLGSSHSNFPTNRIRATFILQKNEIQMLKNLASAENPGLTHLSSFTVTTAYVWACLAKSSAKSGEKVDENEDEYFGFAVDARHRLQPPVPTAYFGNCLAFVVAEIKHGQLEEDRGGFSMAAKLIGELIVDKVNNEEELFREADDWLVKYGHLLSKRFIGVAGLPKFDFYDTDFGWGKPVKYEMVSIDRDGSMSLCKSREFEGGLEIGLSLNKEKMDAFADIFSEGLKV